MYCNRKWEWEGMGTSMWKNNGSGNTCLAGMGMGLKLVGRVKIGKAESHSRTPLSSNLQIIKFPPHEVRWRCPSVCCLFVCLFVYPSPETRTLKTLFSKTKHELCFLLTNNRKSYVGFLKYPFLDPYDYLERWIQDHVFFVCFLSLKNYAI